MNISNPFIALVKNHIQHYNHNKYWKMRHEVINPNSSKNKIIRFYYLYKLKKADAFHNASMGTDFGRGAYFESPPLFPHGLNGIIVSPKAKIGRNTMIYQQVTIAQKNNKSPIIGDNVVIGAGAKIIGGVKIGNNVAIGANSVVVTDVPDCCIAVGVPAKIIDKESEDVKHLVKYGLGLLD